MLSEQITQVRRRWRMPSPWTVAALLIALVVFAPMLSVLWLALNPAENIWP